MLFLAGALNRHWTHFGGLEGRLGGVGRDEECADDGDAAGHHPARLLRVLEHPVHVDGVERGGCNAELTVMVMRLHYICT